jgi:hypothetical protein
VGAHWLAQLLVRAIPPILHDCIITQVHFQTEHLGWRADDFLVEGRNGAGVIRKLAGQVKRNFTVSVTDEECEKAFLDFWADFKNPAVFSTERIASRSSRCAARTRCWRISVASSIAPAQRATAPSSSTA